MITIPCEKSSILLHNSRNGCGKSLRLVACSKGIEMLNISRGDEFIDRIDGPDARHEVSELVLFLAMMKTVFGLGQSSWR